MGVIFGPSGTIEDALGCDLSYGTLCIPMSRSISNYDPDIPSYYYKLTSIFNTDRSI